MCSTVEHVHYGHPNVIILVVAYAFTLQDIVYGVHIMPLVINSLGGGHTHTYPKTYTDICTEPDLIN